ncbi:MAG: ComF family protein [Verrucomicrobiota bacterium]|jgi:ComF family protein
MTFAVASPLRTALDACLNFFYPPVCQICREERAAAAEGFIGPKCWSGVRFVSAPYCERCGLPFEGEMTGPFQCANCQEMKLHFRSARSAVVANALMLDVIHRYKYNRALWFEPFLAGLLVSRASSPLAAEKWDFIAPVPLYPVKEREREFNQAARLAARLGRAVKIPVNERLLRRVKPTTTQTRLTREQRAENVRQAFAFCGKKKLNGEKIVLVDDVLTTGATTNACAAALRKAGAGEICVWTVARAVT